MKLHHIAIWTFRLEESQYLSLHVHESYRVLFDMLPRFLLYQESPHL